MAVTQVSREELLDYLMPGKFGVWRTEWLDFLRGLENEFNGIAYSSNLLRPAVVLCFGQPPVPSIIEEFLVASNPQWFGREVLKHIRIVQFSGQVSALEID